jgi:Flp pilus assembly protein TadG
MKRPDPSRYPGGRRSGKTLVTFALLLPLLLGMVGLAIDGGLLLATQRQTQNAADAAALAAAVDLLNGAKVSAAQATGTSYVQTYNNMSNATVTINIPPGSGPHAGNSQYAEAIVSYPYTTSFIQLLKVNKNQTVTARAVAGYENVSSGEGVMTLGTNPQGGKGLQISGGASLSVNGGVTVDATGQAALSVSGGGTLSAMQVDVAGGTAGSSNVQSYPSGGGPSPLVDNTGVYTPDPYASMAAPTTSTGVTNTFYSYNSSTNTWSTASSAQNITISMPSAGTTVNIPAGIYGAITINGTGGGMVNFQSGGIFVLEGGKSNALDLTASGGTINGNGIMFYDAASNYDPVSGTDTGAGSSQFGGINISASGVNFSSLTSGPYNGFVFFMDRSNNGNSSANISIQGGSGGATVTGITYAPSAALSIAGSGTWNSEFIVNSMSISGQGTVTIQYSGQGKGLAPAVFLVE